LDKPLVPLAWPAALSSLELTNKYTFTLHPITNKYVLTGIPLSLQFGEYTDERILSWVNKNFGRSNKFGEPIIISQPSFKNRVKREYCHPMLRTYNDMLNFSIMTEMSPSDVLYDIGSKFHRWAPHVKEHLAGMIAVRGGISSYDVRYLKNHQPPSYVQHTIRPVRASSILPTVF